MKKYLLLPLLFFSVSATAQLDTIAAALDDSRYFEDQFYLGLYYNALLDQPDETGQNKLSYGFMGGFIKDLPLNATRTLALGIGAGMSFQAISSDLRARQLSTGRVVYNEVAPVIDYKRNSLNITAVEFPLEFRWRDSSPVKYKFWRVHGGVKLSYVLTARSAFVRTEYKEAFSNPDVNDWFYGGYLAFGYNTWNFYVYYQLNSIFKEGVETGFGTPVDSRSLHAGLIFYIL